MGKRKSSEWKAIQRFRKKIIASREINRKNEKKFREEFNAICDEFLGDGDKIGFDAEGYMKALEELCKQNKETR